MGASLCLCWLPSGQLNSSSPEGEGAGELSLLLLLRPLTSLLSLALAGFMRMLDDLPSLLFGLFTPWKLLPGLRLWLPSLQLYLPGSVAAWKCTLFNPREGLKKALATLTA